MTEGVSITWRGQEVTNPVLRVLITMAAVLVAVLVICVCILVFGLILGTWPIWLPIHALLKYKGRRGFIVPTESGGISLSFTADAFRRVEGQS